MFQAEVRTRFVSYVTAQESTWLVNSLELAAVQPLSPELAFSDDEISNPPPLFRTISAGQGQRQKLLLPKGVLVTVYASAQEGLLISLEWPQGHAATAQPDLLAQSPDLADYRLDGSVEAYWLRLPATGMVGRELEIKATELKIGSPPSPGAEQSILSGSVDLYGGRKGIKFLGLDQSVYFVDKRELNRGDALRFVDLKSGNSSPVVHGILVLNSEDARQGYFDLMVSPVYQNNHQVQEVAVKLLKLNGQETQFSLSIFDVVKDDVAARLISWLGAVLALVTLLESLLVKLPELLKLLRKDKKEHA